MALFIFNFIAFEALTPFNVRKELMESQIRALGHVVRGQVIGQGIMIACLIYFLGLSMDHSVTFQSYAIAIGEMSAFGAVGILLFQGTLYAIAKILPFEREIILENNESLGMIIEGFLIAMALIIGISLYSY